MKVYLLIALIKWIFSLIIFPSCKLYRHLSPSDIFLHTIFFWFLFSPPSLLYCLSHLHYLLFQQVDLLFLINRHPLWSCPAPTSLFSFLSFTPHLALWFPPPVCGCFLHSAGESSRHFSIMIKANLQCSASRHHSTSKIYAPNIWQHFRDHSHTSGRFCASPEKWERAGREAWPCLQPPQKEHRWI